jgi:hypothetical protein
MATITIQDIRIIQGILIVIIIIILERVLLLSCQVAWELILGKEPKLQQAGVFHSSSCSCNNPSSNNESNSPNQLQGTRNILEMGIAIP